MDLLFLEVIREELQMQALTRDRRHLRDVNDPLTLPDFAFKQLYRISKDMAHWLLTEIGPHMRDAQRITYIPKATRVFTALQFMAQGSYQRAVGQDLLTTMSQSSVSRCLSEVTDIIVEHLGHLIHFPNTNEERTEEKIQFMAKEHGFPGIVGCIDCTQIAIIAPLTNDPNRPGFIYYNRKGFYSLNVQIISSANLKILNINARFPGSAHDAGIWQMSQARTALMNNFNHGDRHTYLLGDSGYPLEPWLLTPILTPANMHERNYNIAHKSLRNVVERCNGVLKQRFRCLFKHRTLNYNPDRAGKIIYVCAILHNICIDRNEALDNFDDDFDENENDGNNDNDPPIPVGNGRDIRNAIIENYF